MNLVIASSSGSLDGSNATSPPADTNPGPAVNPAPPVPQTPQDPQVPDVPAQSGTGQVTVTTTSTTLSTSPTSPTSQGTPVYLTATVRPATATGTVQFKDGTTNLGPPVTVANGTASGTTSSLTARSHQLTAGFTPTDPATHGPSTSPPVTYVVTPVSEPGPR